MCIYEIMLLLVWTGSIIYYQLNLLKKLKTFFGIPYFSLVLNLQVQYPKESPTRLITMIG